MFFLEKSFGGTNISRNRGRRMLQLKYKLAKAQGGQDHFQGGPPLKPPKKTKGTLACWNQCSIVTP